MSTVRGGQCNRPSYTRPLFRTDSLKKETGRQFIFHVNWDFATTIDWLVALPIGTVFRGSARTQAWKVVRAGATAPAKF
jgi:hypothetical protein